MTPPLTPQYLKKAKDYLSRLQREASVRHFVALHLWQEMTYPSPNLEYQKLLSWGSLPDKKLFRLIKDSEAEALYRKYPDVLENSLGLILQISAKRSVNFIRALKNGLPVDEIHNDYEDPGDLASNSLRFLFKQTEELAEKEVNMTLLGFLRSFNHNTSTYLFELSCFMEADRLRLKAHAKETSKDGKNWRSVKDL